MTRVCSQETKAAKFSHAEVTRNIEDINGEIKTVTEEHAKLETISNALLIADKKLSNDKDTLTDSLATVQKNYERKVLEITEKYNAKVSTRTML